MDGREMDEIDVSMGNAKVVFKPSERKLPDHLDGWTLYDVYIEDEYAGLVTDTGLESESAPKYRVWKPLEGNAYQIGEFLNRDEAAAAFFRWHYDHKK